MTRQQLEKKKDHNDRILPSKEQVNYLKRNHSMTASIEAFPPGFWSNVGSVYQSHKRVRPLKMRLTAEVMSSAFRGMVFHQYSLIRNKDFQISVLTIHISMKEALFCLLDFW